MEDRPKGLTRKGIYRAATTITISTVITKTLIIIIKREENHP
jgi:hypothetical protein